MSTFFIISLSVFVISVVFAILSITKWDHKNFSDFLFPTFAVIGIASFAFGLVILPVMLPINTTYEEIRSYEYKVMRSKESIVIDLSQYNYSRANKTIYIYDLKKFDSYKAGTEFNDSTRLFIEKHKSFYRITVEKYIVWSNPPYKIFNRN